MILTYTPFNHFKSYPLEFKEKSTLLYFNFTPKQNKKNFANILIYNYNYIETKSHQIEIQYFSKFIFI